MHNRTGLSTRVVVATAAATSNSNSNNNFGSSVGMASNNKSRAERVRKQSQSYPPVYEFRTIVIVTIIFLSGIGALVCFGGVSSISVRRAQRRHYKLRNSNQKYSTIYYTPEEIPIELLLKLDVIIVLGGGAPSTVDEPPIYVQRRCDDAAKVIAIRNANNNNIPSGTKEGSTNDLPILSLSAGTAHLPQLLSSDGLPIWESTSSAAYLHEHYKIDYNTLFVETTSYDTIGNAYYTRTSHTDVNGWRKLLIITNKFHMARTKAIYDWIFNVEPILGYEIYYLESPDIGLSEDAIKARVEKEMKSIESIQRFTQQYTTLSDVWKFMHQNHALYTAEKLVERGRQQQQSNKESVTDLIKKSYGGN